MILVNLLMNILIKLEDKYKFIEKQVLMMMKYIKRFYNVYTNTKKTE